MKYDLIVKDCSAEQARRIIDSAEGVVASFAQTKETLGLMHAANNGGSLGVGAPVQHHETTDTDETTGNNAPANGIDAAGLPWDARIHSSNGKVSAKGIWMKRRGVDDATVVSVEAELRSRGAQGTPAPVYTPQPAAPVPFNPAMGFNPQQPGGPVFTPPVGLPQPAPAAQAYVPQPTVQPTATPETFDGVIAKIQQLFQQNLIDGAYLPYLCGKIGVASITDISGNDGLVQYAVGVMKQDGKW